MLNNSINRYGKPNATRGYFGGKSYSHSRLCGADGRSGVRSHDYQIFSDGYITTFSYAGRNRKVAIVSVSVFSKVLSLD